MEELTLAIRSTRFPQPHPDATDSAFFNSCSDHSALMAVKSTYFWFNFTIGLYPFEQRQERRLYSPLRGQGGVLVVNLRTQACYRTLMKQVAMIPIKQMGIIQYPAASHP